MLIITGLTQNFSKHAKYVFECSVSRDFLFNLDNLIPPLSYYSDDQADIFVFFPYISALCPGQR